MPTTRRRSAWCSFLALAAALPTVGCLDHPLKQVEYTSEAEVIVDPPRDPRRKVDVLFVIDDSGSMGEEQAALAANFSAFVAMLEADEVDADYRIGITTTDNGHPWCSGSSPEAGALQLRSCRAHLDDFVFSPGTAQELDRRASACEEVCPAELAELGTLPTTTTLDGEARPRPWLQRDNVPEGVSTAQALACWGPQGIDGCGYESPLESMRKALVRSGTDGEDGQGFLRDDALLQVVFITDEADCSLGPEGAAAFDPDGERALWPDLEAPLPPSAVCWNAGVECEVGQDGRTHCEPADLSPSGEPAAEGEEVLQPLSRYIEVLDRIDEAKRALTGDARSQVLVSVIGGVPSPTDGSDLDYGPGDDPAFFEDFGVGAGCRSGNGEAVPPVRLRAVAEAFSDGQPNLFSICDDDYRPALEAIAARLIPYLRPHCLDACVEGADEIVEGDLPTCTITREVDGRSGRVATCALGPGGSWSLPEGEEVCAHAVTGVERHFECQGGSGNVELRYLRADGASLGEIRTTCEASANPALDCGG